MLKTHLDSMGFAQQNSEYFQEQSFQSISQQPVPILDHCHGEVSTPKQNFPCCNLPVTVHFAEESGSIFCIPSH